MPLKVSPGSGIMLQIVNDNTQSVAVRFQLHWVCLVCASSLWDLAEVVRVRMFWKAITWFLMPKENGNAGKMKAEMSDVYTNCLYWMGASFLPHSTHLHKTTWKLMKICCCCVVCSLFYRCRPENNKWWIALLLWSCLWFWWGLCSWYLNELLAELKFIATDSSKSKSKKDRKEQRSSFRDVLRAVEEGRKTASPDCHQV